MASIATESIRIHSKTLAHIKCALLPLHDNTIAAVILTFDGIEEEEIFKTNSKHLSDDTILPISRFVE